MAENSAQGNSNPRGTPGSGTNGGKVHVSPRIVVQGGLYTDIQRGNQDEYMKAMKEAAKKGYAELNGWGSAVDAVEKAVCYLEESDHFNAGRRSYVNEDNEVELDAMIMDGNAINAGAVIAVRHFLHPVSLARKVMDDSEHSILCADGALKFAQKKNFSDILDPGELDGVKAKFTKDAIPSGHDTVTAIAIDCNGYLACATSSGGIPDKAKGRVGDAPLVGCGGYANRHGAATTCGHGETIIKMTVAREVVYNMQKTDPEQSAQEAASKAVQEVNEQMGGEPYVGVIAIDKNGNYGIAATQLAADRDSMAWATISENILISGTRADVSEADNETVFFE